MEFFGQKVYQPKAEIHFSMGMLENRKHSKISRQRAGYRDLAQTNQGIFLRSQSQWGPKPGQQPTRTAALCSYPSSLRYILQNLQLGKNCFPHKQLFGGLMVPSPWKPFLQLPAHMMDLLYHTFIRLAKFLWGKKSFVTSSSLLGAAPSRQHASSSWFLNEF